MTKISRAGTAIKSRRAALSARFAVATTRRLSRTTSRRRLACPQGNTHCLWISSKSIPGLHVVVVRGDCVAKFEIHYFCDLPRDNEKATVEVNGKTCWTKTMAGQGKQVCGRGNNGWNEDRMKVTCTGTAVDGKFTVRVHTTLNSAGDDESFGIDNVVLTKFLDSGSVTADFEDEHDYQGWNCNKITTCGSYGKICGGFNTKAKSHDIKKTFSVVPGKYSLSLDFIKIDSW